MFSIVIWILCAALIIYGVATVIIAYPPGMVSFWYIFLIVFGTIGIGGWIYAMSCLMTV